MFSELLESKNGYEKFFSESFQIAFKWIKENINDLPAKGKYTLSNGIFAIVDGYKPKALQKSSFENHHKYIDIQVIVEGSEWILWTKPSKMIQKENEIKYSEKDDIEFFSCKSPMDIASMLHVKKGMFVILWPTDWHMPCIIPSIKQGDTENIIEVKKIVMKIPVEE
jgi:biofilm protein TabA